MIEQTGVALRFKAFFVDTKIGKTGLTVTVDVWKNGVSILTGQAATEIGGGFYSYTLASGYNDGEADFLAVFKTATSTVDQQHIPALWEVNKAGIENLNATISSRMATFAYTTPPTVGEIADQVWDELAADHTSATATGGKLNAAGGATDPLTNSLGGYASGTGGAALYRIANGQITTVSPIATTGGAITIIQGDDYHATDGRAIDMSFTSVPVLTGATVVMRLRRGSTVTQTMSVIDADTLRLQMTSAETAALSVGVWEYEVEATLTSGRKATIARSTMNVIAQIA